MKLQQSHWTLNCIGEEVHVSLSLLLHLSLRAITWFSNAESFCGNTTSNKLVFDISMKQSSKLAVKIHSLNVIQNKYS